MVDARRQIAFLSEAINPFIGFHQFALPECFRHKWEGILNNVSMPDRIRAYRDKQKSPIINRYSQEYLKTNKNKIVIDTTSTIKSSEEFFKIGCESSELTKPIFFYYSASQLFRVLAQTIANISGCPRHHGATVRVNSIKNITVEFNPGFFGMVADVLAAMGYPSRFSECILERSDGKCSVSSNKQYINTKLSLKEIKVFLLEGEPYHIKVKKSTVGFYPNSSNTPMEDVIAQNTFLLSKLLTLLIASDLSRYYPYEWQIILAGVEIDFYKFIMEIYDTYNNLISSINQLMGNIDKIP